jgi:very-short-patch-repair endonuclease
VDSVVPAIAGKRGRKSDQRPGRDRIIAELAGRQHGVVSRAQLLDAGVSPSAIDTRLRGSRLHPLHRGVYAVGHRALVPLAEEMAAVLACGSGSAVSHRAAAAMQRMLDRRGPLVDVTVARSGRRRPGLRVHRSRSLTPGDVVMLHGIPVTTPVRTLLDLAESEPARELERAYDEAITQRLVSHSSFAAAIRQAHGRHGSSALRGLLARNAEPTLTRSEAEERCLALIREAGLPAPRMNAPVAGYCVDFFWPEDGLIVEVDGYRFHSSRTAFERDRRRDAVLQAAGFRIMRVTWRQLTTESMAVVARLARAITPAA